MLKSLEISFILTQEQLEKLCWRGGGEGEALPLAEVEKYFLQWDNFRTMILIYYYSTENYQIIEIDTSTSDICALNIIIHGGKSYTGDKYSLIM